MLGNVIIIFVVVLGFLGIAIATIVILSKYATKHPDGEISFIIKIPGCSFGIKASARTTEKKENTGCSLESPDDSKVSK